VESATIMTAAQMTSIIGEEVLSAGISNNYDNPVEHPLAQHNITFHAPVQQHRHRQMGAWGPTGVVKISQLF